MTTYYRRTLATSGRFHPSLILFNESSSLFTSIASLHLQSKMKSSSLLEDEIKDIEELHKNSCFNGKDSYIDPRTGYKVFTEIYHKRRGKCCGNKCRHCPFNHVNVSDKIVEKLRKNS